MMSRTQVVNKGGTTNYINEDQKIGSENMKMYRQFSDNNPNQPDLILREDISGYIQQTYEFEMESLLCAAQEQSLATNVMKTKMWKQGGSSLCRLYQKHDVTIMYIVSGCDMLCGMEYLYRNENIGAYLHCLIYGIMD